MKLTEEQKEALAGEGLGDAVSALMQLCIASLEQAVLSVPSNEPSALAQKKAQLEGAKLLEAKVRATLKQASK